MSAGLPSAPVECIRCTGFIARTAASAPPVCDDCAPRPAPVLDRDEFTAANRDPTADHENPVDVLDVADAERAAMLRAYLDAAADLFAPDGPLLMPLDAEGKAPIIRSEAAALMTAARRFCTLPRRRLLPSARTARAGSPCTLGSRRTGPRMQSSWTTMTWTPSPRRIRATLRSSSGPALGAASTNHIATRVMLRTGGMTRAKSVRGTGTLSHRGQSIQRVASTIPSTSERSHLFAPRISRRVCVPRHRVEE